MSVDQRAPALGRLLSREAGRYYLAILTWAVAFGGGALDWVPELTIDAVAPGVTRALAGFALFLFVYVAGTALAFWRFPTATASVQESGRSWIVRWVLVPRAGTVMAVFVCPVALLTATTYLPAARAVGDAGDDLVAVAVAAVTVLLAWSTLLFTYAADYSTHVRHHGGLVFPGTAEPTFLDFVYFACSVSTTFGTTDVTVVSPRLRRVVMAHSLIAFVFNTVTVGLLVASLAA